MLVDCTTSVTHDSSFTRIRTTLSASRRSVVPTFPSAGERVFSYDVETYIHRENPFGLRSLNRNASTEKPVSQKKGFLSFDEKSTFHLARMVTIYLHMGTGQRSGPERLEIGFS